MNTKMKLRDENGKIYFGYYILVMSALVGTLIYNGIISTSGVFMMPVTTELGIPVGAFSFYISILSEANIITYRRRFPYWYAYHQHPECCNHEQRMERRIHFLRSRYSDLSANHGKMRCMEPC